MSKKKWLLYGPLTLIFLLACNLSAPPSQQTPLDATQMLLIAGQTVAALETSAAQQTLAAGGVTPGGEAPSSEVPATDTTGPTATLASSATATISPTPSQTPIPCNLAHFMSDITIPDNWTTTPNDHFTKTWSIRNDGSCTWTSGYTLVFDHGDQMGAPPSKPITGGTVPPGGTVNISVDLLSPASAGTYQGWYRLHASDDSTILFNNSSNNWFWLKIIVANPTLTPTGSIHLHIPLVPILLAPSITEVRGNNVDIPDGGTNYTKATCPAGSVVVGGGFSTGGGKINLYNSHPHENGWEVFGQNNSSPSKALVATALCLSYDSVTTSPYSQSGTAGAFSTGYANISCPAGTIMTGGGFDATPSMVVYNSSPFGGNGWEVSVKNPLMVAQNFKVWAFCLSGTTGSWSQKSSAASVSAHSSGGNTVTCPSGTLASGGGFGLSDGLSAYANYRGVDTPLTWNADADNLTGSGGSMTVYGVCLSIP